MNIKQFKIGMAAVLILGIMALFLVVGVRAANSLPPGEYDLEAGQYVFTVPELVDTSVAPTDTPVPPTDTPVPSGHDDRDWHVVSADISHEHKGVLLDAAGKMVAFPSQGTAYGPHVLDDVFGTQFYDWAGGEISYPWQTFVGADESYPPPPGPGEMENDLKHEGYGWIIRTNLFDEQNEPYSDGCITTEPFCFRNIRVQFHAIPASQGGAHRFHSYWIEAEACNKDTGECGIWRQGGWVDFGCLFIPRVNGSHVPLPDDPAQCTSQNRRLHNAPGASFGFIEWLSPAFNLYMLEWGPTDPNDPYDLILHCPDFQCNENGSQVNLGSLDLTVPVSWDTDSDGLSDFNGYSDRYGNFIEDCAPIGLDCIPYQAVGMPVGHNYRFRDFDSSLEHMDFDISPPGERWIEYPN